ncbi:Cystathionine gamma-lyase [Orchesella cincta]|uniref:cystathionine gamma-lyase n=1 Tax=Orchesella cincta TaxID=48709 RepID=A0A1D2NF43_ORCCI|nr:Cystathionine gamma-lyase [Orchesella cincta]
MMGDLKSQNDSQKLEWLPVEKQFATLAVHGGYTGENKCFSAIVPPISVAATFEIDVPAVNRGYEYARTDNPSRKILEQKLAALDGGKYGICYSSGLAAFSAVLSLIKNGDHLICSNDVYGGTVKLIMDSVDRLGFTVDFVDFDNLEGFKKALKPETKMIFLETPANPTLRVFDLAKISKIAHDFNKDLLVVVDNTCLTSYFQRPLSFGVDLVHYSLTKYANGHADVIMGAVITNNDSLKDRLKFYQNFNGGIPSPFDCYLVTRGLKTLPIRMKAVMESSLKVAEFLLEHPKVDAVFHPALPSHGSHKLAKKQCSGHSGLMSFRIKEDAGSALEFIRELKLFQNAGSFGGCESLAELPAYFTHKAVPEATRLSLGITNNFVRLAIGLESTEDLIEDLAQALKKC